MCIEFVEFFWQLNTLYANFIKLHVLNVLRSIRAMEPYHKKTNATAYKEKRYRYINPIRMYIDWTDCYYLPFKSRFRFLPTSFLLFLLYNIIIWSMLYLIIKVVNKGFWKLIQIMRIFHIYNWYWLWKFYEDFFKIKTWNKNQCIVYEQEILVLTWHQYFGKRGSFVIPI